MSRVVQWWLAAAIRLLPPRRRDLGEGMPASSIPERCSCIYPPAWTCCDG